MLVEIQTQLRGGGDDVLLMLLDTQRNSRNTVMALQVLSLYSQSVARLEQNLNLTNPPLLRQDWINSDLPVSLY